MRKKIKILLYSTIGIATLGGASIGIYYFVRFTNSLKNQEVIIKNTTLSNEIFKQNFLSGGIWENKTSLTAKDFSSF